MRNSSDSPYASQHIPALDGLRGIAVLLVMVSHFTLIAPGTGLYYATIETIRAGWVGVDLFFALSGFLITGILIDSRGSEGFFARFYMRRTLRIFPLYYAFVVLFLWVWPAISGAESISGVQKLSFLTYTGNFLFAFDGWEGVPGHTTHLWSLAVEEQFYLLWPLVVAFVSPRRLGRVCLAVIAGAWLSRIALHALSPDGIAGYALLPARMDALAIGAFLATEIRREGWEGRVRAWREPVLAGATLLILICVVASPFLTPDHGPFPPLSLHVQLLGFPALGALAAVLIGSAALWHAEGTRTRLEAKWLRDFGRYSYALYLLHVPLRDVLRDRVFRDGRIPELLGSRYVTQVLIVVVGIAASYVLALLSWHLLEKHFLKLKDRFAWKPAPSPLAPPLAAAGATPAVVD